MGVSITARVPPRTLARTEVQIYGLRSAAGAPLNGKVVQASPAVAACS